MDLPHDLPTENTENTHSNSNIWGLSKKIWAEMGCQFGNPVRLVMFSVQPSGGSLNSKKKMFKTIPKKMRLQLCKIRGFMMVQAIID